MSTAVILKIYIKHGGYKIIIYFCCNLKFSNLEKNKKVYNYYTSEKINIYAIKLLNKNSFHFNFLYEDIIMCFQFKF
jgi:hypothetical protein